MVIDTFKESEETDILFMLFVMIVVDDCSNPTDNFAITLCKKHFHYSMFVEWIVLAVNQFLSIHQQRRNPIGVSFIHFPLKLDEPHLIAFCADRTNVYRSDGCTFLFVCVDEEKYT